MAAPPKSLEDLPLELRCMIYEHVFADCARLPHPLMQVSKQVQAEAIDPATGIIGPKIELLLSVNTHLIDYKLHYPVQGNVVRQYFHTGRGPGPSTSARSWGFDAFGRYAFSPQLLSRMQTIRIFWELPAAHFVIVFRPGSLSPEVTLRADGSVDRRTRVTNEDAKKFFHDLAEKWRYDESGCSLKWVEGCIKDLRKGWEDLRKEARERNLRSEAAEARRRELATKRITPVWAIWNSQWRLLNP